jgi:hypothetical protein
MTVRTKLNHVAMSVPAQELGDDVRDEIVAFYSDVFGWTRLPSDVEPGNPLILGVGEWTQFIYIYPDPDGQRMQAPRMDHYGVEVSTEEELDEILERARRYKDKDDRVEIIEKSVTTYPTSNGKGGIDLTNFYVRYLLPLMVEVQNFAVRKG